MLSDVRLYYYAYYTNSILFTKKEINGFAGYKIAQNR